MAPLVRTGGSRHTGLAAPPHHNNHLSYIRAISGKKARLINELVLPISDDRKDNVRKQYVKCLGEDISERDN